MQSRRISVKPYREHAKRVTEAAKSAFHDLEQSTLQNVELKAIVDDWSKKCKPTRNCEMYRVKFYYIFVI